MVSSILFLFCFLPLFLLCYFLAPQKLRNPVILLGSVLFYAWGAPRFVFVVLGTTLADFYIVRLMAASAHRKRRIALLCLSLFLNLGLLFYFKYSNFFIENVNRLFLRLHLEPLKWTALLLPIGISFYTFETLTYVVDVYRKVHKPLKNFWDYQLYIILFPKLIAGPIVRYHDIADQIGDRSAYENSEYRLRGLYRFFIGLGKKVLIANVMGATADRLFDLPVSELSTADAWTGALSYAFQIYFDFSGYSDMAIGLGLLMGFRFPENFNNPYTARSVTDFWRRWHMTLGAWMRNYLYIPLGGNRTHSRARLYLNLWIVFLASGLWHGAAWGFVIWGAYHGLFLVLERAFLGKWLQRAGRFGMLYTFPVLLMGWVFFRLEHWTPALQYLERMFSWHAADPLQVQVPDLLFGFTLALAFFFSFFTLLPGGQAVQDKIFNSDYSLRRHYSMFAATVLLLVICAARITTHGFNPFIYFRF